MADISVTAANVLKGSNATTESGTAGATVTAGQSVYKDTGDSNKWKLADSDSTALTAGSGGLGIALHAAAANQPLLVQLTGDINMGATLAVGETYVVSNTAGGVAPIADMGTGDYISILGVASTASNLVLAKNVTGVQKA